MNKGDKKKVFFWKLTFGLAYGAAVRGAHLIRGRRDGGSALRGHPRDSHRTMLPAATTHLQRQPETRTFPGSKASRRRPGARKPRRRIGLDVSGPLLGLTKRSGAQSTCAPQLPFQGVHTLPQDASGRLAASPPGRGRVLASTAGCGPARYRMHAAQPSLPQRTVTAHRPARPPVRPW